MEKLGEEIPDDRREEFGELFSDGPGGEETDGPGGEELFPKGPGSDGGVIVFS